MEWSLLSAMAEDDRRSLLATCHRRRFAKGEAVFREGDPAESLHLLAEGTVAVRVTTPIGDVATLNVLVPGDAFGEQALISSPAVRSASVFALEPVQTLSLSRTAFEQLLTDHPSVLRLLVVALDARLRSTSQTLVDALYMPVEKRVYRHLAMLGEVYASRGSIPLTQDDLASMAGTTRQSLNKVLRRAQDDGLVSLTRGRIAVTDPLEIARRAR